MKARNNTIRLLALVMIGLLLHACRTLNLTQDLQTQLNTKVNPNVFSSIDTLREEMHKLDTLLRAERDTLKNKLLKKIGAKINNLSSTNYKDFEKSLDSLKQFGLITIGQYQASIAIIPDTIRPKNSKSNSSNQRDWQVEIKSILNIPDTLTDNSNSSKSNIKNYRSIRQACNLMPHLLTNTERLPITPDIRIGLSNISRDITKLKGIVKDCFKEGDSVSLLLDSIQGSLDSLISELNTQNAPVNYLLSKKSLFAQGLSKLELKTDEEGKVQMKRRAKRCKRYFTIRIPDKLPSGNMPFQWNALVLVPETQDSSNTPQIFFVCLPDPENNNIFKLRRIVTLNASKQYTWSDIDLIYAPWLKVHRRMYRDR